MQVTIDDSFQAFIHRLVKIDHVICQNWPRDLSKLTTWLVGSGVIRTEIDQIIEPGAKWKYDEILNRYGDGATEHFLNINC